MKLQGKGNAALQLLEEVITFEQKTKLFFEDTTKDEFVFFENLRSYRLSLNQEKIYSKIFAEMINFILVSFSIKFQDFRKHQEIMAFIL